MKISAKNQWLLGFICLTTLLALPLATAIARPAAVAEDDFAAIDAYVKSQMAAIGIPGVQLGIVRGDQVVHLQGFGVADARGRAVTPQTPFAIGSLTKSFTALAVMQLVEAGKVALDAPVQKYIPWFTLADKDASAQITVRHLLNQTSGISTTDGNRLWHTQLDVEEAVRQMRDIRLAYPVGTKYQYCNLNYVVLGLLVEKASGQSYADYLNDHILIPLAMRHAYLSRAEAQADGISASHYFLFGRAIAKEGPMPLAYAPTGSLIASVEEMSHYLIAHLNDGKYGRASLLSSQGIAELHTPAASFGENAYGMGWVISPLAGMTAVWHNGDTGRSHGTVILLPEKKLGVILLVNASGFEQLMQPDAIAQGVVSLLTGQATPTPATVPFSFRALYWGLPLVILWQMAGIVRSVIRWRRGASVRAWQPLVTLLLNLAVAFTCLFVLPGRVIPFRLPPMLAIYPEVGYQLLAGAGLGVGWSVIETALLEYLGIVPLYLARAVTPPFLGTGRPDRSTG